MLLFDLRLDLKQVDLFNAMKSPTANGLCRNIAATKCRYCIGIDLKMIVRVCVLPQIYYRVNCCKWTTGEFHCLSITSIKIKFKFHKVWFQLPIKWLFHKKAIYFISLFYILHIEMYIDHPKNAASCLTFTLFSKNHWICFDSLPKEILNLANSMLNTFILHTTRKCSIY